jgi:hypothetical protein
MSDPIYHVIFRTCDAVKALRGDRPFGLDKRTLIEICFLSLLESLDRFPHTIHVLGDKLSPELMSFFSAFTAKDERIIVTNGDYGNDESIRRSIALALQYPAEEWVYFCEDDYLHQPHAFTWIDELIRSRATTLRYTPGRLWMKMLFQDVEKRPLFIHPADYPDRYHPGRSRFSLLFITTYNHWRQISDTTFTFLAEVKSLQKYQKDLVASAEGARDDYLSHHLYANVFFRGRGLCVSPIPGLATHMTLGVMSPLVDWEPLVQRYQKMIGQSTL